MGFHFPPEIERLRQQSNLELEYDLPRDSNVVALPLGWAREGLRPSRVIERDTPPKAKQRRPKRER